MSCAFCGGGDRWIKTCLAEDGSRIRVCDPCWKALQLVIVPGDTSVTARCDLCGRYSNPREFAEARPGGRKDAYSGICGACARGRRDRERKSTRMKKAHDYVHYYRGYWSDGGKCRIRIYQEDGRVPVVICSQLQDNANASVTNMAEYLAAEVIEKHGLATPLAWIEHYPEHNEKPGEYSLVTFSLWEHREVCLGGEWRYRIGSPRWSPISPEEVNTLIENEVNEDGLLVQWRQRGSRGRSSRSA